MVGESNGKSALRLETQAFPVSLSDYWKYVLLCLNVDDSEMGD